MAEEALTKEERKILRDLEQQHDALRDATPDGNVTGFGRPDPDGEGDPLFTPEGGDAHETASEGPVEGSVPVEFVGGEGGEGQPNASFFDPGTEGGMASAAASDSDRLDMIAMLLESLPERLTEALQEI